MYAVCRPDLICWTVVINVTVSPSVHFSVWLYSSDDGCQLEEFPARDFLQVRRSISLEKQFWK